MVGGYAFIGSQPRIGKKVCRWQIATTAHQRAGPKEKLTVIARASAMAVYVFAAFILMKARLICGRELKLAAFVQNSFAFPMSPLP